MLCRIGITTSVGEQRGRPAEVVNRAYVGAVVDAGGLPIILPVLEDHHVDAVLDLLDALVLSGGGDIDPAIYGQVAAPEVYGVHTGRDRWELALVRAALERDMPVLGICRGAQVLNVALGGTLIQDLPAITDHIHRADDRGAEVVHPIAVRSGLLARVLGGTTVGANTLHHQAVGRLATGLRAAAWAQDGTIEAIEFEDGRSVLGVQWHPEMLCAHEPHRRLFEWVVAEGARARGQDGALAVA
jgi:putative glutamine amidotransferase